MVAPNPNITGNRPEIRQLDEAAINRIAAGEVVERPASAVKELVENALDAGATRIDVAYADGGKTLISVTDDGCGMTADDLPLALSRHATSKIDGSDLLNIRSFGFRGEALPSLGAVGRLRIVTRAIEAQGAEITVTGGQMAPVQPAASAQGTRVELRDLFFATPARLKFMRTERAEAQAIADTLRKLAISEPAVGFTLTDVSEGKTPRKVLELPAARDAGTALRDRLRTILGAEFIENAIEINAEREGVHLTGYAALPTYSRGAALAQHMFVNGRPVADRQLTGALRAAYSDFLSRDRHPAAALFVTCDPTRVDVNVHPAKAEVRFRDPGVVRGLIVSGLKHALAGAGHRSSTTVADGVLGAMRPEQPQARIYQMEPRTTFASAPSETAPAPGFAEVSAPSARAEPQELPGDPVPTDAPLGAARAQVHENYIVAQTEHGIVLVDQHAAHERLVYERFKRQARDRGIAAQALLIPEIIELAAPERDRLLALAGELTTLGLGVESFGATAIAVRETPAMLGEVDVRALIADILDALGEATGAEVVEARIDAILSRMACHGSIRSGRQMRVEEMNALLREMEATPHSGQCNHGRPTYVELKLSDIERLFGRT